jgi:hypothetical protein
MDGQPGFGRGGGDQLDDHGMGEQRFAAPNSARTPLGSITVRERYGADLHQTGGSPSTDQGVAGAHFAEIDVTLMGRGGSIQAEAAGGRDRSGQFAGRVRPCRRPSDRGRDTAW